MEDMKDAHRNWQFPDSSTFHALRIATSPHSAVSIMYVFPLKILVSLGLPGSSIEAFWAPSAGGPNRIGISPVCKAVAASKLSQILLKCLLH
jgi:hypothetical protein